MTNKHLVTVEGNTIPFFTYEEYKRGEIEHPDINDTYKVIEFICSQLNINPPYLQIVDSLTSKNPNNGAVTKVGGITYYPEQTNLDNCLILLSRRVATPKLFTGVIAHELRHIWQHKNSPMLISNNPIDYLSSLFDPAEIDADAFAIWYLSEVPNMNVHKAGSILCPNEELISPKTYNKRIEKAMEISKEMNLRRKEIAERSQKNQKQPNLILQMIHTLKTLVKPTGSEQGNEYQTSHREA